MWLFTEDKIQNLSYGPVAEVCRMWGFPGAFQRAQVMSGSGVGGWNFMKEILTYQHFILCCF